MALLVDTAGALAAVSIGEARATLTPADARALARQLAAFADAREPVAASTTYGAEPAPPVNLALDMLAACAPVHVPPCPRCLAPGPCARPDCPARG